MFLNRIKLHYKLIFSFGLIVFILFAVNIYSNFRLLFLQKDDMEIGEIDLPKITELSELLILMADFRISQLTHASTTEILKMQMEEKKMESFKIQIDAKLENYQELNDLLPEEKKELFLKNYFEIDILWQEYLSKHAEFLMLSNKNKNAEALSFLEGEAKFVFDPLNEKIRKLLVLEKNIFLKKTSDTENIYGINVSINLLLLFIPLGISFIVINFLVKSIKKPIQVLEKASQKIALGEFDIQVDKIHTDDEIGRLTAAFQKMTDTLVQNKEEIALREWIRQGRTSLNDIIDKNINPDRNINDFAFPIFSFIADYIHAQSGVLYLYEESKEKLIFCTGYAVSETKTEIAVGEGLIGSVAKKAIFSKNQKQDKNKVEFLNNTPKDSFSLHTSLGDIALHQIALMPFKFEKKLIGVMEFHWLNPINAIETSKIKEYLYVISSHLGIGFHTQLIVLEQHDLLEETQKQARLLETQASHLEEKTQEISQQKEEIEAQRDSMENLLCSILPKTIAQELQDNGGRCVPKSYDLVTVMFTDFVGFTRIASKLQPGEIIKELEYCFSHFDDIIAKHNLERIKTIGDSYMCAGGVPIINHTNPLDVVKAALEMKEFMIDWKKENELKNKEVWEIRIGIHSGPVVAGVLGKKYAYDIWGDAVNVASRMESNAEKNQINISDVTYQLVKEEVNCACRGEIEIKNRGKMLMYTVDELFRK